MATPGTSLFLRLEQLQDVIDDNTEAPLYQPLFRGNHPATSLVKEGYLRFTDNTKKNVKLTWNGWKLIKKFLALGFLTGLQPDPLGVSGTTDPPCPPCPPCPPRKTVTEKIIQSKD